MKTLDDLQFQPEMQVFLYPERPSKGRNRRLEAEDGAFAGYGCIDGMGLTTARLWKVFKSS